MYMCVYVYNQDNPKNTMKILMFPYVSWYSNLRETYNNTPKKPVITKAIYVCLARSL
jgi:hypothetical protein